MDKARKVMLDSAMPAMVRFTLVLVWPSTNYGSLKENWINLELDDQLPQVIPILVPSCLTTDFYDYLPCELCDACLPAYC